jgi:MraZ protein
VATNWFVGEHERRLDPKGRVALPVDFRDHFEPQCFLTMGEGSCIAVLTQAHFDEDTQEMLGRMRRGEISRDEMRAKAASTVPVRVDGQGRINVPEKLRAFAGIEVDSPVVVAGAYDRLEIWQPERFAPIEQKGTEHMAQADS